MRHRRNRRRLFNSRSGLVAATAGADQNVSAATHTYFYDDWNLVEERVAYTNGTTSTTHYYWGKDLSGSLQGAGGVGGLLYLTIDGIPYVPHYDNNGNVTRYFDSSGATVAAYAYDAFGRLLSSTGPLADAFPHRFSTKYFDPEAGLYYYGYRFYSPSLMRWLNRDPIEEDGGVNLYALCANNAISNFDGIGQDRYIDKFDILGLRGTRGNRLRSQPHVGIAVDLWKKVKTGEKECCFVWVWIGIKTFDYKVDYTSIQMPMAIIPEIGAKGRILQRQGMHLHVPQTVYSHPSQDEIMRKRIEAEAKSPSRYNVWTFNCIYWAWQAIEYGLNTNPDRSSCVHNSIRKGKHAPSYPSL